MSEISPVGPAVSALPAAPAPIDRFISVPFVLMCIVGFGFIGMLLVMAFHTVPAENKDMLNTLLGSLGTAFTGIVLFYFGSSRSSQTKDDTISTLSKG